MPHALSSPVFARRGLADGATELDFAFFSGCPVSIMSSRQTHLVNLLGTLWFGTASVPIATLQRLRHNDS